MELFEHDPFTGVTTYFDWNDEKLTVRYDQKVDHIIDHCKALANEGGPDQAWKKQGFSLYATLPMIVLGQMAKKGIKFLDQNDVGRVVQEVNQNYPWLKTTTKHHEVR